MRTRRLHHKPTPSPSSFISVTMNRELTDYRHQYPCQDKHPTSWNDSYAFLSASPHHQLAAVLQRNPSAWDLPVFCPLLGSSLTVFFLFRTSPCYLISKRPNGDCRIQSHIVTWLRFCWSPACFTPWGILAFVVMGDKSDVRCAVVVRGSVFLLWSIG